VPAPKEIVNKWVDAFNARDVEAIVSLYHKDAVNHQVANESVAGRDAIREMFTNEFSTAKTGSGLSWSGGTRWACADVAFSMW